MKFYEKIIGINKDAPAGPELTITFSDYGFEFNKNIYLNGEDAIFFRNSQTAISDLDYNVLRFNGNGKNLEFDFGDQSDFTGGAIYAYNWSLGSLYSPLNDIHSTNGHFTNIEALPNNYLKLKAGTAEMTFEENSIEISSSLEVLGDITATNLYGATAFTDHPNDWVALDKISGVTPKLTGIESNKTYQVMISLNNGGTLNPFDNAPVFVGLYNNMTAIYDTFPNRGQDRYTGTTFSFIYLAYPSGVYAEYYILYIAADGSCFLRVLNKSDPNESWVLVHSYYTLFFRKIN